MSEDCSKTELLVLELVKQLDFLAMPSPYFRIINESSNSPQESVNWPEAMVGIEAISANTSEASSIFAGVKLWIDLGLTYLLSLIVGNGYPSAHLWLDTQSKLSKF